MFEIVLIAIIADPTALVYSFQARRPPTRMPRGTLALLQQLQCRNSGFVQSTSLLLPHRRSGRLSSESDDGLLQRMGPFWALIGELRRVRGQTLSYPCLGRYPLERSRYVGRSDFLDICSSGSAVGRVCAVSYQNQYCEVFSGRHPGRNHRRPSGAPVARLAGLRNVAIESTPGMLSDHYDPRSKTLRLSQEVYFAPSVAAAGIAAHETGHALQDA